MDVDNEWKEVREAHTHSLAKGCVLVVKRSEIFKQNGEYANKVDIFTCLKHNVETSKSGVEWGYHTNYYWKNKIPMPNYEENSDIPIQDGEPVGKEIEEQAGRIGTPLNPSLS